MLTTKRNSRTAHRSIGLGAAALAVGAALIFPGIAWADDGSNAAAAAAEQASQAAAQQATQQAIQNAIQADQQGMRDSQNAANDDDFGAPRPFQAPPPQP